MANDMHSNGQINGSYGYPADTDDDSHFNHSNGYSAHAIEADKIEAIAVVGLALKFPQEATDPDGFWRLLVEGRSAMTNVPADRFNIDAFRNKGPHNGATIAAQGGHFVKEDPAGFDAPFFSMNPAEAASMDPQHRWLLETAYQALENAGIPLQKVAGSKSSVHVGLMSHDYEAMQSRDPDIDAQYRASGLASSMASNRLSWFFDFRGPSLTIDTACSSSLNALHLACQSLRIGESNMGVVGGCNLMLVPDAATYMSDMNFLSPDSRSYSFDHRANGYARGEGVGVVILKRLTDALRDGDMVRAVIRATGINQDGRTLGITQPSKEAQYQLIRDTYHDGGIDIAATRYFESHGTGTQAGDPIEAAAIRAAFDNHKPLYIGALKSNIGHLEGASGVAAIIKTILVLEKGLIPPNLWFERPNAKIPMDAWNFRFPIEPTLWPTDGLRRASINSFGFGGANVHAVLDDACNFLRLRGLLGRHCTQEIPLPLKISFPAATSSDRADLPTRPTLLVWSAADEEGLARMNSIYENHLQKLDFSKIGHDYLEALSFTLSERRTKLLWRSFNVIASTGDLRHTKATASKPSRSNLFNKIGFVFTGQGAQWPGMGRELLEFPLFRNSLEDADRIFRTLGCEWSLIDEVCKGQEASRLDRPSYSQPICTALQVALVDLLCSWNIKPAAVVGHSSGEIAAAYCIGGISKASACKIAYYRGVVSAVLQRSGRDSGCMMTVGLSESEMQRYLAEFNDSNGQQGSGIAVGCINSPRSVTLSGDTDKIDLIESTLKKNHIFVRRLTTGVANHSSHMEKISHQYSMLLQKILRGEPIPGKPVMFSSLTGKAISVEEVCSHSHWVDNLIHRVNFYEAVVNMCASPSGKITGDLGDESGTRINHVLELGPHAALRGPLRDIFRVHELNIEYHSVLDRGKDALCSALETMGKVFCSGYPVNLSCVNGFSENSEGPAILVNLPQYPFNHSRKYWQEGRLSRNLRFRKFPPHELLGSPVLDWNNLEPRWIKSIKSSDSPWVKDHRVDGSIVYPAAGMLVMVLEAARQLNVPARPIEGYVFRDVCFRKALVLPPNDSVEVQTQLKPVANELHTPVLECEFRIFVQENHDWAELAAGVIRVQHKKQQPEVEIDRAVQVTRRHGRQILDYEAPLCSTAVDSGQMYKHFASMGMNYGPRFRLLENIHVNDRCKATAVANLSKRMDPEDNPNTPTYAIHPAALDVMFQLTLPALTHGVKEIIPPMVVSKILDLYISENIVCEGTKPPVVEIFSETHYQGFQKVQTSVHAMNGRAGELVLTGNFQATLLHKENGLSRPERSKQRQFCQIVRWRPDPSLLKTHEVEAYCSKLITGPAMARHQSNEDLLVVIELTLSQAIQASYLEDLTKTKPHFKRYIDWARHCLPMDDQKARLGLPVFPRRKHLMMGNSALEGVYEAVEKSGPQGQLSVRVARNLLGILRGEVDVLELLFRDNLMDEYYKALHREFYPFRQVSLFVDALAHKQPNLRVLEIGAGTGGMTESMLDVLMHGTKMVVGDQTARPIIARTSEYVFTDISPAFFEKAKDKFRQYLDRMTFAVLNIEKDPAEQGFENGSYDVIAASNVLHATQSLEKTLKNARKLLKPGGKLLLYELVVPGSLKHGFAFGLLPGWWLGLEDFRAWGPMVTEDKWDSLLRQADFSGVDVALKGAQDQQDQESSMMITTALTIQKPLNLSKTVLVTSDDSNLQIAVAEQLKIGLNMSGHGACEHVTWSQITSINLDNATCIFLPELDDPLIYNISKEDYKKLQKILSSAQSIIWTTGDEDELHPNPRNDLVVGLSRCLRIDNDQIKFIVLRLNRGQKVADIAEKIVRVWQTGLASSPALEYEMEYKEIDGFLSVPRVVETAVVSKINEHLSISVRLQDEERSISQENVSRRFTLSTDTLALLDTVEFGSESEDLSELNHDEIGFDIMSCGLNYVDAGEDDRMTSKYIGLEFAGVVTQLGRTVSEFRLGDKICGLMEGSFRPSGRCKAVTAAKIPDGMNFNTAAAIPADYCTAYYALVHLARMRSAESILVHSGAGGLGQATIRLAKHLGAKIYATVNRVEEKKLLMDRYAIPNECTFLIKSPSLVQNIMGMTNNRGVNVVVNALDSEALHNSSLDCLAPFGRYISTGRTDIHHRRSFPGNTTIANVRLAAYLRHDVGFAGELVQAVMDLVSSGTIGAPVNLRIHQESEIEEAFLHMQKEIGVGKTIIEISNGDKSSGHTKAPVICELDPNATYLVSGGLGGLGKSIARWMANRNAKNIILLSRSGVADQAAEDFVVGLRSQGINVVAPQCDISDISSLKSVLSQCSETMAPIKGCIQAAMVTEDAHFANMDYTTFSKALAPKVLGSYNLHKLLPQDLTFFILLSSLTGIVGVPGQANYAAGNTYQDALARYRFSKGQHAVSIDLGMMVDAGSVSGSDFASARDWLKMVGFTEIREIELLALLDWYCTKSRPLLDVEEVQLVIGLRPPGPEEHAIFWAKRHMFSHLVGAGAASNDGGKQKKSQQQQSPVLNLEARIRAAASAEDVTAIIAESLKSKLAITLGIKEGDVDMTQPIVKYGIDSLVAVDVRTWFVRCVGADVPVLELLGGMSVGMLAGVAGGRSSFVTKNKVETNATVDE